jgi:hypothetical protein
MIAMHFQQAFHDIGMLIRVVGGFGGVGFEI